MSVLPRFFLFFFSGIDYPGLNVLQNCCKYTTSRELEVLIFNGEFDLFVGFEADLFGEKGSFLLLNCELEHSLFINLVVGSENHSQAFFVAQHVLAKLEVHVRLHPLLYGWQDSLDSSVLATKVQIQGISDVKFWLEAEHSLSLMKSANFFNLYLSVS
jgi:hypothetical protein